MNISTDKKEKGAKYAPFIILLYFCIKCAQEFFVEFLFFNVVFRAVSRLFNVDRNGLVLEFHASVKYEFRSQIRDLVRVEVSAGIRLAGVEKVNRNRNIALGLLHKPGQEGVHIHPLTLVTLKVGVGGLFAS